MDWRNYTKVLKDYARRCNSKCHVERAVRMLKIKISLFKQVQIREVFLGEVAFELSLQDFDYKR